MGPVINSQEAETHFHTEEILLRSRRHRVYILKEAKLPQLQGLPVQGSGLRIWSHYTLV